MMRRSIFDDGEKAFRRASFVIANDGHGSFQPDHTSITPQMTFLARKTLDLAPEKLGALGYLSTQVIVTGNCQ